MSNRNTTEPLYPALLTTDLHLTDAPADEYRWSIFDTIEEQRRKHKARTLLILGDITDAKDRHSSTLVNRIVDALTGTGMQTIILQGNHDYLLLGHPFFEFLNSIPGVQFITKPTRIDNWVFLPHSRKTPLPGLDLIDSSVSHCFMHQTVNGATASNGQRMEGEITSKGLPRPSTCKYYSGDIHVPQFCGHVEYVGSPYPVHFGDAYKPRMIVLEDEEDTIVVPWRGIRREVADIDAASDLDKHDLEHNDQLKVRLHLSRAEAAEWHVHKEAVQVWCDKRGVRLSSIELQLPPVRRQLIEHDAPQARDVAPLSVLQRYASSRGIDEEVLAIGSSIIRKAAKRAD